MRMPIALAMALTASLAATVARAQPPVETSVTGSCTLAPDLAERVHEAAARETLPIADHTTIAVTIACESDPIMVHLVARSVTTETARDLSIALAEQDALTDAVVLCALLALDELDRLPPPAPTTQLASTVSAPDEAPAPASPAPLPPRGSPSLSVGAGVLFGIASTAAAGLTLRGGYRWDDLFSVEAEGVGAIPDDASIGGGQLETATLSLRVAVCADASLRPLRLGGCLGAWGGALSVVSQGFASGAHQTWAAWTAADGRVRATLEIDDVFLRVEGALLGVVLAPVLVVDAGAAGPLDAGRVGPLAGWVGLVFGVSFRP